MSSNLTLKIKRKKKKITSVLKSMESLLQFAMPLLLITGLG